MLEYVVRRDGGFYRPEAAGYTLTLAEAGRWSKAEADKYAVNCQGVTVHHVSEFKPDRLSILMTALEAIDAVAVSKRAGAAKQMQAIARAALRDAQ